MKICPCCKRPISLQIKVGGQKRQRLFDYIFAHSGGATSNQLMNLIYADDPDGGPENPNVISVMVSQINKKLKPLGYAIRGSGGPGSTYAVRREPLSLSLAS